MGLESSGLVRLLSFLHGFSFSDSHIMTSLSCEIVW